MAVGKLTIRQTVISKMTLGEKAVGELTWYLKKFVEKAPVFYKVKHAFS